MFNYVFIPAGSTAKKVENLIVVKDGQKILKKFTYGNTFVLDVGNMLGNGIIDHHQPGLEETCTSEMIGKEPQRWIGQHLKKSLKYNIVLHKDPDLDALGAAFLTKKYIEHGHLPNFIEQFTKYILEVDIGRKQLNDKNLIELFSIVLAISWTIRNKSNLLAEDNDINILRTTFSLFNSMWEFLGNGCSINDLKWDTFNGLKKYIHLLKNDQKTYDEDLNTRSQILQLRLKQQCSSKSSHVDCLISKTPKSVLWKYWARGDIKNAPQKKGFICTIAFLPSSNTRAIISIDSNSNYSLKGLGLYLDYLEIKELLKNTSIDKITGEKRPGFHRENPWYDGRSTAHNFSIIDSPIEGSVLSEMVITSAVLEFEEWGCSLPEEDINLMEIEDILKFFDKR